MCIRDRFVNAEHAREIIFVRGTTEGLNLVASSYGRHRLKPGDEILVSEMEHHSNIVPWQIIAEQTGSRIRMIPMDDSGQIIQEEYLELLHEKTAIVAITYVANSLGTVNPIKQMTQRAHDVGAVVVVDAAQAAPHLAIDVRELDCDFLTLSGHKMYGPTGIGILYGREELLDAMPPYQGGGEMIKRVTFAGSEYAEIPHKFEAGTPNIADSVGFGEAAKLCGISGLMQSRPMNTNYLNTVTSVLKNTAIFGYLEWHRESLACLHLRLMVFTHTILEPLWIAKVLRFEWGIIVPCPLCSTSM